LAITYNNMAVAYEGLQKYSLAIEHGERAVNIASKTLGANHSLTVNFRTNLDRIRQQQF